MALTVEEVRGRLEADAARNDARVKEFEAKIAKAQADQVAAQTEARSFLLGEARTRAKERQQAQASGDNDPVGKVGRALDPGPIRAGAQAPQRGLSLEGVGGGASGGQAAQQALQGRSPGAQGVPQIQSAPTQVLTTRQQDTRFAPIATGLRGEVTDTSVRQQEQFVPGQLTQGQALSGQLKLMEAARLREEEVFGQLSNIALSNFQTDADRQFFTDQLSRVARDPVKLQALQRRILSDRAVRAEERNKAVGAFGKNEQDIRNGVVPPDQVALSRERAGKGQTTNLNVGITDLTKTTQSSIQKELLGHSALRDQVLGIRVALSPELTGLAAQGRALGLSTKEQIAGIPIVGDVIGELTPQQGQFLDRYRALHIQGATVLTEVLKEMSGTAVNPTEAQRLLKRLPKEGDSFGVINSKLRELEVATNLGLAKGRIWQAMGSDENTPPWAISGLTVMDKTREAVDFKFNQLKAANPGASDLELARRAVDQVEQAFNLTPGGYELIQRQFGGVR